MARVLFFYCESAARKPCKSGLAGGRGAKAQRRGARYPGRPVQPKTVRDTAKVKEYYDRRVMERKEAGLAGRDP